MLARPMPPEDLLDGDGAATPLPIRPALDVEAWARATFIDDDAPLFNEEHIHLQSARVGFMWCSVPNGRHGLAVVGQTELPQFQGGRWSKARQVQQIEGWFGEVPDFLITLHADYCAGASDASFCALVEHELLHCGHERGPGGEPKFRKDGRPALAIRGHDVEEFVSIVRRYGVGSAAGRTRELVEAAALPPEITAAEVAGCCGTCGGSFT